MDYGLLIRPLLTDEKYEQRYTLMKQIDHGRAEPDRFTVRRKVHGTFDQHPGQRTRHPQEGPSAAPV